MPREIENRLEKIIRTFMWGDSALQVKAETLYKSIEKGGRGLLDIRSWNEAIYLSWTKDYMRLDEERPTWAYLMNELI